MDVQTDLLIGVSKEFEFEKVIICGTELVIYILGDESGTSLSLISFSSCVVFYYFFLV